MEVQVKRTLVVPPPPTCETEEVPLTVFDLVAPTYHVTVLFAFSPPNPTTRALLDALSAMLPHFPLLTARLERRGARRRPFFVTGRGGAGALVVEAEVSSELADHLPLAPSPELARLHPPVNTDAPTPHVLLVQINRFACGGLVVTFSFVL
jgi:shikimate O-hydroxycinnamoyltransferase